MGKPPTAFKNFHRPAPSLPRNTHSPRILAICHSFSTLPPAHAKMATSVPSTRAHARPRVRSIEEAAPSAQLGCYTVPPPVQGDSGRAAAAASARRRPTECAPQGACERERAKPPPPARCVLSLGGTCPVRAISQARAPAAAPAPVRVRRPWKMRGRALRICAEPAAACPCRRRRPRPCPSPDFLPALFAHCARAGLEPNSDEP
ncbi:hypothetical protein C8Q78DRAFT_324473 [Trametes maxima]|nr:hypothetical protein C8Q78DRAFT_324473 [Trametes maxima]